ncbi:hypothetical protein GNZ10_13770 [Ralstonia sp. 3N]|uniref:hypothetical protein n=1 Tax=Ralstonia sp. 3N TaxID=2675750 RepID=UPI0015C55C41|nr:hypothetical protein [Ralstonia sp. 3N]NPT50765.1 hypothetical protein [Ralstonia sp. 3N]
MSEMTPWFRMSQSPVYPGKYEARERHTGLRFDVYWKKLEDTNHHDWFIYKGVLGPFNLWESARDRMTSWRGLTQPPATSAPTTKDTGGEG